MVATVLPPNALVPDLAHLTPEDKKRWLKNNFLNLSIIDLSETDETDHRYYAKLNQVFRGQETDCGYKVSNVGEFGNSKDEAIDNLFNMLVANNYFGELLYVTELGSVIITNARDKGFLTTEFTDQIDACVPQTCRADIVKVNGLRVSLKEPITLYAHDHSRPSPGA